MTDINIETLPYRVGGLLYTPAVNESIADKITENVYECLTSIAFCLEDSIMDDAVDFAEQMLIKNLSKIYENSIKSGKNLPLIFVRVRNPQHLCHVGKLLEKFSDILTGYILPKFDLSNGKEYISAVKELNTGNKKIFAMPILESPMIADKTERINILSELQALIYESRQYILNIRVGGNDFCRLYGLRRPVSNTIYDMGVIRDILTDIINVFARDFVVSGAVWEYFESENDISWKRGLVRELELDRLNGFIGKTAIHPSQLPLIYKSLMVTADDYRDALAIINWDSEKLGVGKSSGISRMNEVKCHINWAKKIKILGDIYGIKEKDDENFL